jgi:FG-GAP-like repeat
MIKRGSRPAAVLLTMLCGAAALVSTSGSHEIGTAAPSQEGAATVREQADEAEARAACGSACHAYPPPQLLPSSAWRETIARMTLILQNQPEPAGPRGTAARTVTLSAPMQRVLRFYQRHAPDALPAPTPWPDVNAEQFTVHPFSPPDPPPGPAISHARFVSVDEDGRLEIVAADMRYGLILVGRPMAENGRLEVVATASNPAHVEPFDLDEDGTKDLLVADLGQFLPADHTDGAVVWMRGLKRLRYAPWNLSGWPRVADVRAGDFNGDGKADLLVGAFGWRKVGQIAVLENQTSDYDRPAFVTHTIDPRPGTVHTIPVDLNGDGRLDFIALISQQYETVVAFRNTGPGFSFEPDVIYTAPHPNWGSSGIEVIDLDADGDQDVLLAHGDTFDDTIIKPYHGIQWLENTGRYPFEAHTLADLPGVFGAKAGDLDGDGDLDVVACAFIAGGSNLDESSMPSLVWLEQVRRGVFERRTLERKPPRHATLDLADVDSDGDLDILVGTFATEKQEGPWIELWENRRRGQRGEPSGSGRGPQ